MTLGKAVLFCSVAFFLACHNENNPPGNAVRAETSSFSPEIVHAQAELGSATASSYGHPSSQRLHFSVCLRGVGPGTSLAIGDGMSPELVRKSDSNGCVRWNETHAVSMFAPQHNIRVRRQIHKVGDQKESAFVDFTIKPWAEGREAVQAETGEDTEAESVRPESFAFNAAYPIDERADQKAQFNIDGNHLDFRYVEVGRDGEFSIDPYLNLSIPYRFTFSFQPLVTHRLFSGAQRSDVISSGRLKVTFVFFASGKGEPSQDTHYLTSAECEGEIGSNGIFSGTLLLKYPHMLFASGRQTVLMQVSPVGDGGQIQSRSFSGSLSYLDQQTIMTMLPDGRDGEALHRENTRRREESQARRLAPLADYMNHHDLFITGVDEFPGGNLGDKSIWNLFSSWQSRVLTQDELQYAMATQHLNPQTDTGNKRSSISVKARLCRAYMAMTPGFGMKRPIRSFKDDYVTALKENDDFVGSAFCANELVLNDFVNIREVDFVEELASNSPRNVKMFSYSNQEFGIYYSNEHAQATTEGFAVRMPGMAMLGGLFNLSIEKSNTQSMVEKGNFGMTQMMAVDFGTMEVHAKVRSCLLVSGLREPFIQKPWLICKQDVGPAQWIPEQFFYYSQIFAANHSPFIDPFSPQTGVKVFIRGQNRMQRIMHGLQEADFQKTGFNVFVQAHVPDLNDFDTMQSVDALTDQDIPGAFSRN